MSKLTLVIVVLLIAAVSAFRLRDMEGKREYGEGKPEMLLERGLIPEYEDDPEVYRDTAWLLDSVILNDVQIAPYPPPVVIYRIPSGNKQECIDGKKTIPPQCQWTGWVIKEENGDPEELKLTVDKKYCTRANLTMPEDKVVDC